MYKKALVPVSGQFHGKRSVVALQKAMDLCDGEIILLHATEAIPQLVGGEAREELVRDENAKGLIVLAPLIEILENAGRHFHTVVIPGSPAECIVHVADEQHADLIVMFTDGQDSLGDVLLGSITERVLRNTDIDLLAVRH